MIDLRAFGVRTVLLDIEGTTTPVSFVHDVLFPFARARLRQFLASHPDDADVVTALARLADEHARDVEEKTAPPTWDGHRVTLDDAVGYLEWLMDLDRKSPGLKLLQGLIWQEGYQRGELRGEMFADVPRAMRHWRDSGLEIAIYSSGSERAQRLLFGSTPYGDLTPLIMRFFDTAIGAKVVADSYRRIAGALGRAPADLFFITDLAAERDAAREAGCQVALRGSEVFSTDLGLLVPEVGPSPA